MNDEERFPLPGTGKSVLRHMDLQDRPDKRYIHIMERNAIKARHKRNDPERLDLLEPGDVLVVTQQFRRRHYLKLIEKERGAEFLAQVTVLLIEEGVTDYESLKEAATGRFVIDPAYADNIKRHFVAQNLCVLMGRLNRERGHPRPPLLGCFQQGAK